MIEIKLLMLLIVANGAPIIAKKLFGRYLSLSLDLGLTLADGQRLFGHSKTVRGWAAAAAAAAAVAPLLGISWSVGAVLGAAAMAGDLLSSFIKRRLNKPPSSMALGLDQIPESLLPCLLIKNMLALGWINIVIVVTVFFVGELLISQLLYKLHIRDRPY